jgi:hypothetical protein
MQASLENCVLLGLYALVAVADATAVAAAAGEGEAAAHLAPPPGPTALASHTFLPGRTPSALGAATAAVAPPRISTRVCEAPRHTLARLFQLVPTGPDSSRDPINAFLVQRGLRSGCIFDCVDDGARSLLVHEVSLATNGRVAALYSLHREQFFGLVDTLRVTREDIAGVVGVYDSGLLTRTPSMARLLGYPVLGDFDSKRAFAVYIFVRFVTSSGMHSWTNPMGAAYGPAASRRDALADFSRQAALFREALVGEPYGTFVITDVREEES